MRFSSLSVHATSLCTQPPALRFTHEGEGLQVNLMVVEELPHPYGQNPGLNKKAEHAVTTFNLFHAPNERQEGTERNNKFNATGVCVCVCNSQLVTSSGPTVRT